MSVSPAAREHQAAACQILAEWGIDPSEVLVRGCDRSGYTWRMKADEASGYARRRWPEGFPVDEFLATHARAAEWADRGQEPRIEKHRTVIFGRELLDAVG